jgi:hypothetical protein
VEAFLRRLNLSPFCCRPAGSFSRLGGRVLGDRTVRHPPSSTATKYPAYNDSFRFAAAGTGTATATFAPAIPVAGNYEVFVWQWTFPTGASNTPHTIAYPGGSTTILVNQQGAIGGGAWLSLGTYPFAAGTGGTVTITNNANGQVVADAIRWSAR